MTVKLWLLLLAFLHAAGAFRLLGSLQPRARTLGVALSTGKNVVTPPSPPPTSAEALRSLIANAAADKRILHMPCCYDGLTARLVERAGFEVTFMTGLLCYKLIRAPFTQHHLTRDP